MRTNNEKLRCVYRRFGRGNTRSWSVDDALRQTCATLRAALSASWETNVPLHNFEFTYLTEFLLCPRIPRYQRRNRIGTRPLLTRCLRCPRVIFHRRKLRRRLQYRSVMGYSSESKESGRIKTSVSEHSHLLPSSGPLLLSLPRQWRLCRWWASS